MPTSGRCPSPAWLIARSKSLLSTHGCASKNTLIARMTSNPVPSRTQRLPVSLIPFFGGECPSAFHACLNVDRLRFRRIVAQAQDFSRFARAQLVETKRDNLYQI